MNESVKPTIRDIARMAGVSRSTVSLVINEDPRISELTKARVLEVIEAAGYEPNAMARSLARRRSDSVAVVLPKTDSHVFADFYFGEAISGISSVLSQVGFRLVIQIADEHFLENRVHVKLMREGGVDGMLLLGTVDEDAHVQDLIRARVPVVLVNSRAEGAAAVVADNRRGAKEMVRYLAGLGHRRIGFIGGLENTTVGAERSAGFLEGLEGAGIPFAEDLRLWGNFSEESGAEAARTLLARKPRPSALMAANDMMAIGALRVAQDELGLAVPEELTIVGADDIRLTTYLRPRLTTISQPIFEIGRQATHMLLESCAEKNFAPRVRVVPTELVIRESSASPAVRARPAGS